MLDTLKTTTASRIVDNYYLEPCMVNEDPLEPGTYALPNDVVLLNPPENQKLYKKYKLNEDKTAWIEEIDNTKVIGYKNHLFYFSMNDMQVIDLLLCLKLKQYSLTDADGNNVLLNRKQLKKFKQRHAYKHLELLGYSAFKN